MAASQQCGAFLLQFIYIAGMDITKVYFKPLKPNKWWNPTFQYWIEITQETKEEWIGELCEEPPGRRTEIRDWVDSIVAIPKEHFLEEKHLQEYDYIVGKIDLSHIRLVKLKKKPWPGI